MRSTSAALVFAVALLIALAMHPPHARAQTPASPCGIALYTPTPGSPVTAGPMASELSHLESCTGLIAPVFYVGAYGAVPNTGTDQSGAIQSAENACNSNGGGTVFLAAGTYYVQTSITFYASCTTVGSGVGATVVKLCPGVNGPVFISQNFASLTGTNSTAGVFDTGFKNMSIDGNQSAQSAGAACVQYYGYNPIFSHVRIQYCFGDGLYSEWGCCSIPPFASAAMIDDVRSIYNGSNGITWKGPHDGIWHNITTYLNGNIGTLVSGNGEGLLINGFHSWGNTQLYALYLDSGIASVICTNCITEGATVSELYIDGPFNTIQGQAYDSAGAAVDITLGGTHGAGTNQIIENVNASVGQTGAILAFGNDVGKNQIQITAFCNGASSTPATSGTEGALDIISWSSSNCTGTPSSLNLTSIQGIGTVLNLSSHSASANSGNVQINNGSGANNNNGFLIFDGGTTNGIHFEPVNATGIATYQFNSGAPSGACIVGSIAIRTDTGAGSGSEVYVCRNVSGTGTWEALTGG